MEFVSDVEAYAAKRKPQLQSLEDSLVRSVLVALRRHDAGDKVWASALISRGEQEIRKVYRAESGKASARGAGLARLLASYRASMSKMLAKTKPDEDRIQEQTRSIAASMAALILSSGTVAAGIDSGEPDLEKFWINMDDNRVRAAHRDIEAVPLGDKFEVAGVKMSGPGDMSAPIELWINCRCIVGVQSLHSQRVAATINIDPALGQFTERMRAVTDVLDIVAAEEDDDLGELDLTSVEDVAVPWHGVLVPEGVVSGDRRRFREGSVSNRDLPLPLSWQKVNAEGHDGSVVIGSIDRIWKDDAGLVWGEGMLLDTPEASEYVGLNAAGASRGVSVDVDSASFELVDPDGSVVDEYGDNTVMDVTMGRVSGATACAIPAFQEAFIRLGRYEQPTEESLVAAGECIPCQYKAGIDEAPFHHISAEYTDEQWADACLVFEDGKYSVPIYTPDGRLSRSACINAVGLIPDDIGIRSILSGALVILGEQPLDDVLPVDDIEGLFAAGGPVGFVKTEDGPGWLTHPTDTERLRRYWTKGKGALKIRWGTPGDFNRCRLQLAKYIKPQYLNGYCANRHYDALGFWPGRPVSAETLVAAGAKPGRAFSLVASVQAVTTPPRSWFEDPHLLENSPLVVTEEGRVFGHIAEWNQCHIGFGEMNGQCVMAPHSITDYAYFQTGAVLTDDGMVATGPLTMGTGHEEDPYATWQVAAAHYDNTGYAVADVAVGEDKYGIWCAGWVRPGTPIEKVIALRASQVSGDWRTVRGNLEMIAALVVNVGGFSTPRTALAASGGVQVSLVAAGVVPRSQPEGSDEWEFDPERFAQAVGEVIGEVMAGFEVRRGKMAQLRVSRDPKARMAALAARRGE